MKLILEKLANLRGPARHKSLDPAAAEALRQVESFAELIYLELWRDPVAQLLAERINPDSPRLGYNGHGFGISINVDLTTIPYDRLLVKMRKMNWHCPRRGFDSSKPDSGHFNFLGPLSEKYLLKCSWDPLTWNHPVEELIYDRYGLEFQIDLPTAQGLLAQAGFYYGTPSGALDVYTREALLAFQRAWRLPESGQADQKTCRVLRLVSCEIVETKG